MVLFTHDVKKIKGAAHKNGDVHGTRKRSLLPAHKTIADSWYWQILIGHLGHFLFDFFGQICT